MAHSTFLCLFDFSPFYGKIKQIIAPGCLGRIRKMILL